MSVDLSPYALLELDEAKLAIKAGDNFTETDTLIAYINGVTDHIERYCGRVFLKRELTETFNGNNRPLHVLEHAPVYNTGEDVPTLTVDNVAISATVYKVDATHGIIYLLSGVFTKGIQNCEIEYTTGYDTVPDGIRVAAIIVLTRLWRLRENQTESVGSVTLEGQTIMFRADTIPPEARAILDGYRRVRFA